jgi:membrane associated rhomboid family serine protease
LIFIKININSVNLNKFMSYVPVEKLIYKFESHEELADNIRGAAIPVSCRWWDHETKAWATVEDLEVRERLITKDVPLYLLNVGNFHFALKHASSLNPWTALYFKGKGEAVLSADGESIVFTGQPRSASAEHHVALALCSLQCEFAETVKLSGATPGSAATVSMEFTHQDARSGVLFSLMLNPASMAEMFEVMTYEQEKIDAYWLQNGRLTAAAIPLIALSVALFVLLIAQGAGFFQNEMMPYLRWAASSTAATPYGEWWRLVVSQFTHYGIIHLALNMFALYSVGVELEPVIGRSAVYVAYLFTGTVASIGSLLIHDQPVWSCGASGAIFGLIGVLMGCFLVRSSTMPGGYAMANFKKYLWYIGLSVFYTIKTRQFEQTDFAAHFFGLGAGFALGVVCSLKFSSSQKVVPPAFNWTATGLLCLSLPWLASRVAPGRLSIDDMLYFDSRVVVSINPYSAGLDKLNSLLERGTPQEVKTHLDGEMSAVADTFRKALASWSPEGAGARQWRDAAAVYLDARSSEFAVMDKILRRNDAERLLFEKADLAELAEARKQVALADSKIPEFYPPSPAEASRRSRTR